MNLAHEQIQTQTVQPDMTWLDDCWFLAAKMRIFRSSERSHHSRARAKTNIKHWLTARNYSGPMPWDKVCLAILYLATICHAQTPNINPAKAHAKKILRSPKDAPTVNKPMARAVEAIIIQPPPQWVFVGKTIEPPYFVRNLKTGKLHELNWNPPTIIWPSGTITLPFKAPFYNATNQTWEQAMFDVEAQAVGDNQQFRIGVHMETMQLTGRAP